MRLAHKIVPRYKFISNYIKSLFIYLFIYISVAEINLQKKNILLFLFICEVKKVIL